MDYLKLDKNKTSQTVFELNILLADYHIYYQKLRNFHWNVLGENFFDLHEKFEEMYNDTQTKIDEIAERILTLRFQPVSNYSDYLKLSNLKESTSDMSDKEMITKLLEDHGKLIDHMRKVSHVAEQANDEGTIDMMGGYIRNIEKISWMLDAWRMKTTEVMTKPVWNK